MKSIMVNMTLGLVLLVTLIYLCEAQSHRFSSFSSSRRSPSSRFSRTFNDRRQSTRLQPVRSRSWSRSSQTRVVPRQSSFRQSNRFQSPVSSLGQSRQQNSIDNLSNAILLSALLGMDMPREQRMSSQRMIVSRLLGIDAPLPQNQPTFSSFSNRGSSSSVLSPSTQDSGTRGSFISSLPGHNLIVQSPSQPQHQPLVIEAGGQIQVQEIKKPDGQTQVVINAGQNTAPSVHATTKTASTVPAFSTANPYILSGEDPPEKETPPLQDVQELTKLLKAMGINPSKAAAVGR
ncbi:uncharacterized protein LOC132555861 [Ylistrum balloti]|uniref:uncharacterized protein LOC132555861 n=1 Tax=Ylistrum balloti TaxID=509963 RepID=UPI002905C720|nr:uncharacterized protein LOC132555861 [Ylistrum balloti]